MAKAPGKAYRKGISHKRLGRMFPDSDAARVWLEAQIWPQGPFCPHCDSFNVQCGIRRKTMTHRCRGCPNRPQFPPGTGAAMQGANRKGAAAMTRRRGLETAGKRGRHAGSVA